jgi:hypothetical protein
MIRSTLLFVLCMIVLASNMQEADALAAIVRRVRTGIFGIGRREPKPAPASFVRPVIAPLAPPSPPKDMVASFDTSFADSLRKDMTELVYERSMARLHVN